METEERVKEGTKRAMKELEMEQKLNRVVRINKGEKLTIEEWEEIGEKVKETHIQVIEVGETLSPIPKGVWRYDYDTIIKGLLRLKDKLDERVFDVHQDEPTERLCNVFYGEKELNKKMKIELESENLDSRPLSYDGDNKEIVVELSFYVKMSLGDARILGDMPHRNIGIGDYFNAVRGRAFRDRWKITVELKGFEDLT